MKIIKLVSILFAYTIFALTIILCLEYFVIPYRIAPLTRELYLLGFIARPNIVVDDTRINSMGFAGDVLRIEKPPQAIRILTLGGSSFFNRRLAERLKRDLSGVAGGRKVEVLGGALRTHTTMASVYKYETLSKYRFDYVLIYEGINDLWANNTKEIYFKKDYSHLNPWYKRNFLLSHSITARCIYNGLWYLSKTFKGFCLLMRNPLDKNRAYSERSSNIKYIVRKYYQMEHNSSIKDVFHKCYQKCYQAAKDEEYASNGAHFAADAVFEHNLKALINEIRKNNGRPVLMTFASYIPDNYSRELFDAMRLGYNNPTRYDYYPIELWGERDYVAEGLKRYNSIIRKVAKENDVLLIDQENLMKAKSSWFGDVCHFSEEGTDVFIQNISDFFVQHGLLGP